jgi:hypothetical protein
MNSSDWEDYTQEQIYAEEETLARIPRDLHEDAVRSYLGCNGDAIDQRVESLLSMATGLLAGNFQGPSAVVSVTALETMIQYFCVRPIVEGGFLSDLLAREVTKRITGSRSADQRSLLAAILRPWGIEIDRILLENGKPLWSEFQSNVVKKRDGFVHRGDDVSDEVAVLALKCATEFRAQVVMNMAKRLGFTHDKTHCWSKVTTDPNEQIFLAGKVLNGETNYRTRSPFV